MIGYTVTETTLAIRITGEVVTVTLHTGTRGRPGHTLACLRLSVAGRTCASFPQAIRVMKR